MRQIGVRWEDNSGNYLLSLLLDGAVTLAGLGIEVDDLSVTIPVKNPANLAGWKLGLAGLGISYSGGGIRISGALRQVGGGSSGIPVRYEVRLKETTSGRLTASQIKCQYRFAKMLQLCLARREGIIGVEIR